MSMMLICFNTKVIQKIHIPPDVTTIPVDPVVPNVPVDPKVPVVPVVPVVNETPVVQFASTILLLSNVMAAMSVITRPVIELPAFIWMAVMAMIHPLNVVPRSNVALEPTKKNTFPG